MAELAIRRRARYVAVMASQSRAALILRELERRLYTPAGLGAKTAGEIAVSILAEAVAALRGDTGRSLRGVKNPRSVLKEVEGESRADYKCDCPLGACKKLLFFLPLLFLLFLNLARWRAHGWGVDCTIKMFLGGLWL